MGTKLEMWYVEYFSQITVWVFLYVCDPEHMGAPEGSGHVKVMM